MSKSKYPKNLTDPDFDLSAYKRDLVKQLLQELFKIVQGEQKAYGKEFADEVVASLLASFVSTVVYNSLARPAAIAQGDEEQRYQLTCESFEQAKRMIEDAVASGFTGGFQAFDSSFSPDYQCDVSCLDPGDTTGPIN